MEPIKVNLIAGSGTHRGPDAWIFSDMVDIMIMGIDPSKFQITITEDIDESQLYDVYHYLHSTLAVKNGGKMAHRALVTVQAMSPMQANWSFEYKEPILKKARKISSVSTTILRNMASRNIPVHKMYYTPAGVDTDVFKPTPEEDKDALADKYNVDKDVVRFGIVSRCYGDNRKGEQFLLSIMRNLDYPENYRFMFVGKNWKKFITDNIHENHVNQHCEFFERDENCTYDDYPDLYGLMDIVLVPSRVDAGPICILEALAKGLPIVSTPTGLANELLVKFIDHDVNKGKIVAYGDIDNYVETVKKLVLDIDRIRNIEHKEKIANLIEKPDYYCPMSDWQVHSSYTWVNFCKRFEEIYEQIYLECKDKKFLEDSMNESTQTMYVSLYANQASNNLPNIYMENYFQIKNYAKPGLALSEFKGILENYPAVVVGAGPSLNKDLPLIKEHQDDIAIFSCDAALPVLEKNGIIPDVVVVADPSDRQGSNFTGCSGNRFLTVMPTVVHPMTFNEARKNDCNVIWYNIADANVPLCQWIPKDVGYKGFVRPSVLTSGMVYQIALFMGCSYVTFVGHDLSWEWDEIDKGYAEGVNEKKVLYQRNNKIYNHPVLLLQDINDNRVVSDLSFFTFVHWMNHYLREFNLNVTNSTGCGILYGENIILKSFEEWVDIPDKYPNAFEKLYQQYITKKMGNDTPIIPHNYAG